MRGCLVGLIISAVIATFSAIFRLVGMVLMLMFTATTSLFTGPGVAIDRISTSWIEQATSRGVPIGYNQAGRDGTRAAATAMLVVGWILLIATLVGVISLIANQ